MGRGSSSVGGGGGGGGGTPKLQALTGSEKQIAWAEDIRQGAYNQLDHLDSEFDRMKKTFDGSASSAESIVGYNKSDVQAVRTTVTTALNAPRSSSASVIIENRSIFSANSIKRSVQDAARQRKLKNK